MFNKKPSQVKIYFYILLALIGLSILALRPSIATAVPLTAQQELERAWRLAANSGAYQYQADATQTSHPTASLENSGRHPQSQNMRVAGLVDPNNETMELRLWNQETSHDGLEIKVEDGQALGRMNGQEEWTEIDNPTDLFAPGGDPFAFLSAADNVELVENTADMQESEAAPSYARYRFDVNGPHFAEYVRQQMQTQMTNDGELPPGVSIGIVQQYADMTGWGEIWLDEDGLPVRQVVHLEFPPEEDALDWYEANITAAYSGWDISGINHQLFWAIPRLTDDPSLIVNDPLSLLPTSFSSNTFQDAGNFLGFGLIFVALALFAYAHHRSPRFYASIATLVIVSMLVGPLLQINQVEAFYERQQSQQPETEQQEQTQQLLPNEQAINEFDPKADRLSSPSLALTEGALQLPTEDCQADIDTDGDGLDDNVECYQLGTFPYSIDTDGDGISDKTEVAGFPISAPSWFLNPLEIDSNGDGLSDIDECFALVDVIDGVLTPPSGTKCPDADGDNVPDVFDFDNDGDGVPDNADSSPDYTGDLSDNAHNAFSLSLSDYDTSTTRSVLVEFELRPEIYEHIYQTHNVFDWPSDDKKGQITRIHDTTFADEGNTTEKSGNGDVLVTPMVEIRIPAPANNSANPSGGLPIKGSFNGIITNDNLEEWLDTELLKTYNISVRQDSSSRDLLVYVPLVQKLDPISETPVTWAGQMLYRPESGSWGNNQTVRQVWLVEALIEECLASDIPATFSYQDDQGNIQTIKKGDANAYEIWCANEANWKTKIQLIHTYYENFYLTGLVVREDYNYELAVIAQNNALNTPYENYLWHLSNALSGAFIEGHRLTENGDRFDIDEIIARFGSGSPYNNGDPELWGIPTGTFSMATAVNANSYPDQTSAIQALVGSHIPNLLSNTYPGAVEDDVTTLLIAHEDTFKMTSLNNPASVNDTGNDNIAISLSPAYARTHTSLNWSPYKYETEEWASTDLYDYQDELETTLEDFISQADVDELLSWFDDSSENLENEEAALVGLARSYYTAIYLGMSSQVKNSQDGDLSDTVLDNADYNLDYASDGQPDNVILYLTATFLDPMQQYFSDKGEIIYDEVHEILYIIGEAELHLDKQVSLDNLLEITPAAITASSAGFEKGVKELAKLKGHAKWKGKTYFTRAATTMGLGAGALMGVYTATGSKEKALLYVTYSLETAQAAISVFSTVKDLGVHKYADDFANTLLTLKSLERATKATAVVGFVADAAVAGVVFYLTVRDLAPGSELFNRAIAQLIAVLIVAMIYLILNLTIIGSLVVDIIALIDALVALTCFLVEEVGNHDIDDTAQSWACGGLTGALTKALAYGIYDSSHILDLGDPDRLKTAIDRPILANPALGMVAGNEIIIGTTITNSIKIRNNLNAFGYTDLYSYFTFFTDSTLRRSSFTYTLQDKPTDQHHSLGQNTLNWPNNTEIFNPIIVYRFDEPGINLEKENLYLTEAYNIPSLECWGFFIQKCSERSYKGSFHNDWSGIFSFDILPRNFDGFVDLSAATGNFSYRQSWSELFPILVDGDGDGLNSREYGGPDSNDSFADTDHDGLTDFWEYDNGFDANAADGDGDGLGDYWEHFYGTNPYRADTDGDGLLDSQEFFHPAKIYPYENSAYTDYNNSWTGGWRIIYDYDGNQSLQTLVSANPQFADFDGDFIPDYRERVYGYNPNLAEEINILGLDSTVSGGYVAPEGTIAYTATVKNELDNRAIEGLLQVEFPVDQVQSNEYLGSIYPQMMVTTTGEVTAPPITQTEVTSLTVRAGALIDDSAVNHAFVLNFNETEGNVFFDATSARNDFICSGGSSCPVPNGGTAAFSGTPITRLHHDDFNRAAFTLSARVYPSAQSVIIYNDTNDFQLALTADRRISVSIDNVVKLTSNKSLNLNQWIDIVVTFDANTGRLNLYINGLPAGSASGVGAINRDNGFIEIGAGFQGQFDSISLYNLALSEEEVTTNFDNLVFYADFDQGGCGSNIDHISQIVFGCGSVATVVDGISGKGMDADRLRVVNADGFTLASEDESFSASIWIKPKTIPAIGQTFKLLSLEDANFVPQFALIAKSRLNETTGRVEPYIFVDFNNCLPGTGHALNFWNYPLDGDWNNIVLTYSGVSGGYKLRVYYNTHIYQTVTCTNSPHLGTLHVVETTNTAVDEIRLYSTELLDPTRKDLFWRSNRALQLEFDEPPGHSSFANSSLAGPSLGGAFCVNGSSCPTTGIPGRTNQAVAFDSAQGQYVRLVSPTDKFGMNQNSFTAMAWVKGSSFAGTQTILGTDSAAPQQGLQLGLQNGQPYMSFGGPGNDLLSPTGLNPDQWYHLAWSYNYSEEDSVGEQAIYVNGTLAVTKTNQLPFVGNHALNIGRSLNANYFDGMIDDVIIVQQELGGGAIASYMREGSVLNLHLDEDLNTTNFVDESPYQNTAVCSGNACPAAGVKGQLREAAIFDGYNDLLTTVDGADELHLRQFTIGMWVKPTRQVDHPQYLIAKEKPGGSEQTFVLTIPPNSMFVTFDTHPRWYEDCYTGWQSATSENPLQEDVWNHVMLTYDTHRAVLYINGAAQAEIVYSDEYSLIACPTNHPIVIGNNYSRQQGFAGHIDEVFILDHGLTTTESRALFEYQSAWYDARNQHRVVIDADTPILSIDVADYYPKLPTILPIFASDPTSIVATLAVTMTTPSGITSTIYSGNDDGDWIIEFDPDEAGAYTIEALATDLVGNASFDSKTFYVDDTSPTAALDGSLTGNILTTSENNLTLFGPISDPGSPASGVVTGSVAVDVRDWKGASLEGFQTVDIDGDNWSLDYPFADVGYGKYDVRFTAVDGVGNTFTNTLGSIKVDDLEPYADLLIGNTAITTTFGGEIFGVANDIPYPMGGKTLNFHFDDVFYIDSSANGFRGTCTNCPNRENADGKYNGSMRFDGLNDALTIPAHHNLVVTNTTMIAWVKPTWTAGTNGYNPTLLAMDDGSQSGYRWQIADDYQAIILNNGSQSQSVPVNLAANEWVHLALTVDDGRWTSYVNGVPVGTITQTMGVQTGLPLQIGSADGGSGFFGGLLDELVLYSVPLNAEAIYDIANPIDTNITDIQLRLRHLNGAAWIGTVDPAGLALYMPFDDEAGSRDFQIAGANTLSTSCVYYSSCPTVGFEGYSEGGASFDNFDSIAISDEAAFDFDQVTAAAWIKVDAFDRSDASIITKGISWSLQRNVNQNTLAFVTYHVVDGQSYGTPHRLVGGTNIADGQWHFVAAVYDGRTKYLYVDNVLENQQDVIHTHNPQLFNSPHRLGIGSDVLTNNNQRGFNGLIDEVVVFNRPLDQTELGGLMTITPWQQVDFPSQPSNYKGWSYQLPNTLEGPYAIDLRVTDSEGNTADIPNVWFGDIDLARPRITFNYDSIDEHHVRVSCTAEDLNLTDEGWSCPADGLIYSTVDADWVLKYLGPITHTGKLSTTVQTINTNAPFHTMTVCDLYHNCVVAGAEPTAPQIEASALLTPTNGTAFDSLAPIHIIGLARSDDDIASLVVTANGQTIYTTTWTAGTTEAVWSVDWTPPPGTDVFSLEATVTNGVGKSFNDPAETIISIAAPSVTIEKSVSQGASLVPGDHITYTITLANEGTAAIQDIEVVDNLPVGVEGQDLNQTVSLNAGQSQIFTIPVTVTAPEGSVVTNTAAFNHSLQSGAAAVAFHTCAVDPVVQNGNSSGPGSLAQALIDACEGSIITFTGTMTVSAGGGLSIDKGLTIDAGEYDVVLDGEISGGALLSVFGQDGPVILKGLTLINGGGEGAAVNFSGPGPITVIDSVFESNTSFFDPVILNYADLTIVGSVFTDNLSPGYGTLESRSGATTTILNSTFSAQPGGGYLVANETGSVMTVTHSTIVESDGGLFNNGQMTVANSIIVGNSNFYCSGTIVDGGYNLMGSGSGCPTDSGTTQTVDYSDLYTAILYPLADNGGKTETFALITGGPAINAIPTNLGGPFECVPGASVDQRGSQRGNGNNAGGGACDIGAYEWSSGATIAVDDNAIMDEDTAITVDVLANDTNSEGEALTVIALTQPANGAAVLNPDYTITYTPTQNFDKVDAFTYTIESESGGTDTAQVEITITPINDPPVADDISVVAVEDNAYVIRVLTNDLDGDALTVTAVTTPTHGTAVINSSFNPGETTITYTPETDFDGADSFDYTISDSGGLTDTGTITVQLTALNDPPTAVDDLVATDEDSVVTVSILANDSDAEGDPLTIIGLTMPSNGTAVLNPDNTVTYTPAANYNGPDSLAYTISDGQDGESTGVISVTVNLVNDNPVAVGDTANAVEETAVTVNVLANDSDIDSDALTVTNLTTPANGSAVINPDHTVTYTPTLNFAGTDTVVYTVDDGDGGTDTAVLTINVANRNDAPIIIDDSAVTNEDEAVTIDVLANDSDVEGDLLTITSIAGPVSGVAVLNLDSTITYTPTANFNGVVSFHYTASDNNGGSDFATVTVTVISVNDAPDAVNDSSVTNEDVAVTVNVLTNDSDVDGDPLTIIDITQPMTGTAVLNPDNTVTYTPTAEFNGLDIFSYTIDGGGESDTASVLIVVNPVNDPPTAVDDLVSTDEDTAVFIDILSNDLDIDSSVITVTAVTTPDNGVAKLNENGTITYTPDNNYTGVDAFDYTVADLSGGLASATVTVTVALANDDPVAADDAVVTDEDTAVLVTVLDNDTDEENDPLTVESVAPPANGTAVVNLDNTITYTPTTNFNGVDSFTYSISDGNGGVDTAVVTVTVNPVNDLPTAVYDTLSTPEDTAVIIDVVANDSDVDGDPLTITTISSPANGVAIVKLDNSIAYTPTAEFQGTDTFTYTISDGNGGAASTAVTITVTAVNDLPMAAADTTTTMEDTAVTIDVVANDNDIDGDSLTVIATSAPLSGTAIINLDNTITYTPSLNFNGTDVFSYTIDDGNGGQASAAITVTITAVNDAPIAVDDIVVTDEDTAVTVNVLNNDLDVDGDALSVTAVTQPMSGTAVLNTDGSIVYTPTLDFNGVDSVTYTMTDGLLSDTAVITIHVTGVNDPPVLINLTISPTLPDEGELVQFEALVSDVDGLQRGLDGQLAIRWDFGDGNWTTGTLTPTHTYVDDDMYTMTIVMTDTAGGSSVYTNALQVANVAPSVDAGSDVVVAVDTAVTFDGSFIDPGQDSHDILWDFGDGEVASGTLTPTHSYTESGTYMATLTVTDDDGGVGSDTLIVTVESADNTYMIFMPAILSGAGQNQRANTSASVAKTFPSHSKPAPTNKALSLPDYHTANLEKPISENSIHMTQIPRWRIMIITETYSLLKIAWRGCIYRI